MATTKRRQLTDEQRAQRRRQEQELTERAVAQLRCSDGWQRWLQVRGAELARQCPGGQKAASLTDAAPPLFGASGRRSASAIA
jgi:hypothetical protein